MTLTLMIILILHVWSPKVRIINFTKNDLDLEPMTLVLKLDLDIVKMFHHTKDKVSVSRYSKVIARTDTQIDTHTEYENITLLTRAVTKVNPISGFGDSPFLDQVSGQPFCRTTETFPFSCEVF